MKKIFTLTFLSILISLSAFANIPTLAPSNPVFSNITPTSMRLAWTNGNGNKRLIVASSDQEPNTIPSLSDYSRVANSSFGTLGTALGNGYIVYNGTGSSTFITNLWNGAEGTTVYYYHVYEYNLISGVYYINTVNPTALRMTASKSPLPWTPNIAPSNPVFTNVTYQSLTLSWTSGNGTRKLVIASKNSEPNTIPDYTDFSKIPSNVYGSGDAIGNGFVVHSGTQNTVTVTNLSSSSQYYFHIYEYNIIYNEYSYNTSLKLAANTSTIALAAPTVISSGAVEVLHPLNLGPGFTGYWANIGNGTGRIVTVRKSSDPVEIPTNNTVYEQYDPTITPALNWKVGNNFITNIHTSPSKSFSYSTAIPGENYCFDVFEYNGDLAAGTAVFNTTPYTFCITAPVSASPKIGPSNPVFSNFTSNSLNLSWTNGNGNRRLVIARKDSLPRPINSMDFSTITYSREYTANPNYGLGTSAGGGFVVYQGSGNSVTVNNLELNGNYYFEIYEMNEFFHEIITTFYAVNNRASANTILALVNAPSLGASSLNFTSVGQNSLTLNWLNGNGSARLVIARKASEISSNPVNNVTYTANSNYGNGAPLGSGFVVYNGNGNSVNVSGLEPGTTYFFTVIEYATGSGNISYANDLKTTNSSTTIIIIDTDQDGVIDEEDQFPTNPNMAFSTSYPSAGFGTLMFEDLWPGKGDYDFNDLVIDYRYQVITDASDRVIEAQYQFVTRAIGGSLHNGFAFQLDGINPNKISSVSGSKASGAAWISLNSNGTEAGQESNTNILVFDDAYKLLPTQGGFSFVNVSAGAPDSGTDTTTIVVKFKDGSNFPIGGSIDYSSFTASVFNPYIIVGQDRGKEVHLIDRLPSAKVNQTYFGKDQDKSEPANGKYYRTSQNLPYALDINTSIPYTKEKTDFTSAYLKFIDWVSSAGSNSTNWYLNENGNRDITKLWNR